ncbi:LysR substrate-binding domain-containing protein [Tritonibacter sp. SIMBA_163]|uniref:LysR substrate-binding domain-containing protein n=1 Tax=Tritonibacter sp. SIMBA_163 TaxID=3080868 RepID=UPI00397EE8E5
MYDDLPPLPWLRAFDASARLGNFTLAAKELGLTPSAVSYQVRGLEAQLGHQLFHREHRVLTLTRLGQAYLPIVTRAFADLDATTSNLFGKTAGDEVCLRCLSSLNLLWLVPRLDAYRRRHPDSRLRVLSASWSKMAAGEEIDIDIRFGDGTWVDGEVVPLMHDAIIAVCAPERLTDGTLQELAEGPLIELAGVVDTWQHFFASHEVTTPITAPSLKVDQSLIALELASRQLGTALVAETLAQPYLDSGKLVRATDLSLPARQGHYLVLPTARNSRRPEVETMVLWLLAEAAASPQAPITHATEGPPVTGGPW